MKKKWAFKSITKAERNAIPAEDFAGPDKSYPCDTKAHLKAATKLYGKADNPNAVKAAIIRIAKRKGWESLLPASWQDGSNAKFLENTMVAFGNEVKALGNNTVGGYLVVFGDAAHPDYSAQRDFFTKNTDFDIATGDHRTAYYAHGMDKTLGLRKLGALTVKDLAKDDVGVWVEAQLNIRDKYDEMIYKMTEDRKLGWSSGAPAHLVARKTVGTAHEVLHWPISEGSLTPKPAEPRAGAFALKSLPDIYDLSGLKAADFEDEEDYDSMTDDEAAQIVWGENVPASFKSAAPRLFIAPLETPWNALEAEKRLQARKAASYVDSEDGSVIEHDNYTPIIANYNGGVGDDVDGDGEPEPGMAGMYDNCDGYVWGYQPGYANDSTWGVFKLPVADVGEDGSLRVVAEAVKDAAKLVHEYWETLGIPETDKPKVKAALDGLFDLLHTEFGDKAPVAPWKNAKETPRDGASFADQTKNALDAITGWSERATGIITLGVKSGRKISAARAERIRQVLTTISETRDTLEAMLDEAAPVVDDGDPEDAGLAVLAEYAKYMKTKNDLRKVGI